MIGAGGVATVAAFKIAQNADVFTEFMIASRRKEKCDAIVDAIHKSGINMDIKTAQETSAFDMIDKPSPLRFPGWPLDSLSINRETGLYFVEAKVNKSKENIIKGDYEKRIVDFLKSSLEL